MLLYMNQRVITSSHNHLSRLTFEARKSIPLILDVTDVFCYVMYLIYVTVKAKPELLDSVEFTLSVKVIFDKNVTLNQCIYKMTKRKYAVVKLINFLFEISRYILSFLLHDF